MVIEFIIYFAILLTALPVGWFLAWLCKDELVSDRKWFYYALELVIAVLVGDLIFYRNLSVILSLIYFAIMILVMIHLGKNRKFMRN